jgi:hypothetical protein
MSDLVCKLHKTGGIWVRFEQVLGSLRERYQCAASLMLSLVLYAQQAS